MNRSGAAIVGLVACLAWTASSTALRAQEPDLARLVDQLSSAEFSERQEATRALREAGAAAIPTLAQAVQSGDAEVRLRAFGILRDHALALEPQRCHPARLALAELIQEKNGRISSAAQASLEAVEQMLVGRLAQLNAIANQRQSGTNVGPNPANLAPGPARPGIVNLLRVNRTYAVQIGQSWRGGDDGLGLLCDLGGIGWLSLESSPVTDAGLVHVGRLADLERLYLGGSQVNGAGLKELAPLTNLRYLSLKQLPIDDDDLASLPAFPELQDLGLDLTEVGDAGLVHLARYPHVNRLWLDGTRVTDAGLTHLKDLPELKTLFLAGTKITGPGLAELRDHTGLAYLSLKQTAFGADGLAHVGQLKQVERLGLDNTNVTDEMLVHLAGMTRLRELWLNSSLVTDAGLIHLRGLKDLQVIHLDTTAVTSEGVLDLQRAIPLLHVTR
jgi:hypothetical protein